jgi:hypothetical protein
VTYLTVSLLGDLLRHDRSIPNFSGKNRIPHTVFCTGFSFAENPDFIEILHNTNIDMYIIKQDEMKGSIIDSSYTPKVKKESWILHSRANQTRFFNLRRRRRA